MRALLNDTVSDYITGPSASRIAQITDSFGKAAILARDAGFDVIQIHGDRMCGSSSSIYNKRADSYGGTAENRAYQCLFSSIHHPAIHHAHHRRNQRCHQCRPYHCGGTRASILAPVGNHINRYQLERRNIDN